MLLGRLWIGEVKPEELGEAFAQRIVAVERGNAEQLGVVTLLDRL